MGESEWRKEFQNRRLIDCGIRTRLQIHIILKALSKACDVSSARMCQDSKEIKYHQLWKKCKCECSSSWVVKCSNPTTQQILKDLPIYFPHYKNGCLEMFLQAGRIIARRPTGTCVYFSKSFVLYLNTMQLKNSVQ